MIQIHSTKHEPDPTLAHSFLISLLILHTIPWLRRTCRLSRLTSYLSNLLKSLLRPTPSSPILPNPIRPSPSPPDTALHNGIPYISLTSAYHHTLRQSWTNDPTKLYLESCFNPHSHVNLATDYGIEGLCPVVKATEGDRFILRDGEQKYYLWDGWSGELRRFRERWTEGCRDKEEVVKGIVCEMTWAESDTEVVRRGR
ncbi:hypothetical protein COCMIDRAFT_25534 [Bipolaris oryzae ATCC 44560]|uniref:Uncharacterized protein n=1 Tax=Bipolaris oryzae ATCC 44560 TaxID=930090 RepID=W6ZRX7_COCMI|nr:uncharacterized protein COCMIDRAFT_25534 [Bipolaris oryzae ATCC 44560]EUC46451.1 hypothetical protein COCMIDRAFT_25534 [Bipolaris oryzae ATCC 44560]